MNKPAEYPKVTQEQVLSVSTILISALTDSQYLTNSTYSPLMTGTIQKEVDRVKRVFEKGLTAVSNPTPDYSIGSTNLEKEVMAAQKPQPVTKEAISALDMQRIRKEIREELKIEFDAKLQQELDRRENNAKNKLDALENEQINQLYEPLAENIDSRSAEYRDNFGILKRLEKMIRGVERIASTGSTDTARLTATTKLMEYQEKQLSVMERLLNINKSDQIERVTRRFFMELKKHPDLKVVAERYMSLLDAID